MTPFAHTSADTETPPLPHGPAKPSFLTNSPNVSHRLARRTSCFALGALLLGCAVAPASAQTSVTPTPDGNVNTAYDLYLKNGDTTYFGQTAPYFFMEDQDSLGWTGIINAVKAKNTGSYNTAKGYVEWGWQRQLSDGSLPHNATPGYDWQQYHSLATFGAQCGWALTNVTRSSWAMADTNITADLATYNAKLYNSALWLTNHSTYTDASGTTKQEGTANNQQNVRGNGMMHDEDFSHRRMMLAAVCLQATTLNSANSSSLSYYSDILQKGKDFASNGIKCALPSGASALLLPYDASNTNNGHIPTAPFYYVPSYPAYNPPADPMAPSLSVWTSGNPIPAGATLISARGVTPELGGFDITYETDYASLGFYAAESCPDTTLKNQIYAQIDQSLLWLASRLKYNCTALDDSSSSRDNVEKDHNNNYKRANIKSVRQIFTLMASRSSNPVFADQTDAQGHVTKGLWNKIYDNLSAGTGAGNGTDFDDDSAKGPWQLGTRVHTPYDLNFTLYPSILWQSIGSSNTVSVAYSTTNGVNSTGGTLIDPQTNTSFDSTLSSAWKIAGVGDEDGDGQPDYLWYNASTQKAAIWLMQPGGASYKKYGTVFDSPSGTGWQAVSFADMDGDGHADVLWYNPTLTDASQRLQIYLTDGSSTGTMLKSSQPAAFAGPTVTAGEASWQVIGTGDYDNDGFPDILWYNPTLNTTYTKTRFVIWLMQGLNTAKTAVLTPTYGQPFDGINSASWQPVGTGDYNNDRNPDILWQSTGSGNRQLIVWYTQGANAQGNVATPSYGNAFSFTGLTDPKWQVVGVH